MSEPQATGGRRFPKESVPRTNNMSNLEHEAPASEKAGILIVDDQEGNLRVLQGLLEDLSVDIVSARSGEEALSSLLDREFAVILLDVRMPIMDGFETAELIR